MRNRYVTLLLILGAVTLALTGCGGGGGQAAAPQRGMTENVANPGFDTVHNLVQEFVKDPQKTDPAACPVVKEEKTSRKDYMYLQAKKLRCYTQDGTDQVIDAAIYWEFKDAAEAERFVKERGTSAEYYFINSDVVVDGPVFNYPKGIYDSKEFLTALQQRCNCGKVVKKE